MDGWIWVPDLKDGLRMQQETVLERGALEEAS